MLNKLVSIMFFKILYISLITSFAFGQNDLTYDCAPCECSIPEYEKEIHVLCNNKYVAKYLNKIPDTIVNYHDKIMPISILDFSDQSFTALNENEFLKYSKTKKIIFSNNEIIYIHPESLGNLNFLTELSLDNNKINNLPPEIFSGVPQIKYIFLNNNNLTILESNLFSNLLNLEQVHLNRNQISTIQTNCFVNVPSLYEIDLSYNQLKSLQLSIFDNKNNEKLQYFYLNKNPWVCNRDLCELINKALNRNWLQGRIAECYYGNFTKTGRTWKDLQILEPLSITPYQLSSEILKKEGDDLILTCEISTCSLPKMLWKFNNTILSESSQCKTKEKHSLNIKLTNLTENDSGFYTCTIEEPLANASKYLRVSKEIMTRSDETTAAPAIKCVLTCSNGTTFEFPNIPDVSLKGNLDLDLDLGWLWFIIGLFLGIMIGLFLCLLLLAFCCSTHLLRCVKCVCGNCGSRLITNIIKNLTKNDDQQLQKQEHEMQKILR